MIEKLASLPLKPVEMNPKVNNASATELSDQFGQFLNNAMQKLEDQQTTVDRLNEQFIKGELSDTHQLMIASERAALGLQLTVQVRNKVIEAYQDIMRMQL